MEALALSPDVLRGAADQAGESLESLARAMVKREGDRERVVRGELTPPQAEKLAKLTGVPFGLLFLPAPPTIQRTQIPDLRQTLDPAPLSRDFLEVWDDVSRKQQWHRDRLIELGATPLPFVGRFNDAASRKPDAIARDMTEVLGLTPQVRAAARSADEYFSAVAEAVASATVQPAREGGGGSPYRTIPARNSKRLTLALVRSALSGETLLREAAGLLAVRPETAMELGKGLADRG